MSTGGDDAGLPAVEAAGPAMDPASQAPRWIVVAMYTDDFKGRAAALERSCREHGVPCHLERIDAAEYRRTIAFKPTFMLRMLMRHRRPIVYLDADFEVKQYPALFDNPRGADLMIYNWYADPDNSVGRYQPGTLLCSSGVVYWNHTRGARRLLREWSAIARANPHCADDQILDRVFNQGGYLRRLSCEWLPQSYLRIAPEFPDTAPVLDHADAPGSNGPPGAAIRSMRRPPRWWVAHHLRSLRRRIARGLGRFAA